MGSPVPAESATIGSLNSIFTRIGASDDIGGGRSTFMVEITEAAKILNFAGENSLVLIDEIGRGTSTKDGLALAWSIAEDLSLKNKSLSIFATHYFELTELSLKIATIENFHFETIEQKDNIVFLYELKKGAASNSFGLKVAKLAGVPIDVINRATNFQKTGMKDLNIKSSISYFGDETILIPEELLSTNINEVTPLEALILLSNIKNKYGNEE